MSFINTIIERSKMIDFNAINTVEDLAAVYQDIEEEKYDLCSAEWLELTNIATRIQETLQAETETV